MPRRSDGNGEGKSRVGKPESRTAEPGLPAAAGERSAASKLGRSPARKKGASPREQALRRWKEVEALVRSLEPRIVEVFRSHSVEPQTAGVMLEEVVTLLLYRWGEVARPEAWVMEMLEHRARRGI